MTSPVFGLEFRRIDDQPQPVLGSNLDVIGLIGPCNTAKASRFPFDTPVLAFSNDETLGTDLGTDGFLADAINGIIDQLADFEVAAQLVIVRTDYGAAVDPTQKAQQTLANIMGSAVLGTGVHAFVKAPNMLFCTPRLICAPGYTGLMANSINSCLTVIDGVGYIPNQLYQITFVQGGGELNAASLRLPVAHIIANSDGTITDASITIDSYGCFMSAAPTCSIGAPDGPPVTATAAGGSIIFTQQPGIGATIGLNGSTVAFIANGGTPVGLQVALGTTLAGTITALLTFLNGSADAQITKNTYTATGGTLLIACKLTGISGNTFTLATTVAGATLSASTMTGGRAAVASTQVTLATTVALGANPVCAELGGVLDTLMAHAFVESAGTSTVNDFQWRSTMNHRRLVPTSGGCKVFNANGDIVIMPLAPRIIGAQIARDHETGYPFHSAANTAIQGIVGPSRTIAFSLTDGATEGQTILAANVGILVRGNVGVESAISSGGFIYIGTDNAGDDELWRFVNVNRGRDYIELSLMPALRVYLGRQNIDRQTVINIVTTIRSFLNRLWALSQILGARVDFKGALNSAEEIRAGHLVVGFQAEEPPVLRRITTMSARYRPAIDAMVSELEQELAQTA